MCEYNFRVDKQKIFVLNINFYYSKILNMPYHLIYIHIGSTLDNARYIIDSIYQTLLINREDVIIHVIISDDLIVELCNLLEDLNLDFSYMNQLKFIPSSTCLNELNNDELYNRYINNTNIGLVDFRDSFWISTTSRFFYIYNYVKNNLADESYIFHIENDIMVYVPFSEQIKVIEQLDSQNISMENSPNISMVKDSPNRVIASILIFKNAKSTESLVKHITKTFEKSKHFINDMDILASYDNMSILPHNPLTSNSDIIFDGACIGQYLGGVDPRNLQLSCGKSALDIMYNNPSMGFINETCDFKCNDCILSCSFRDGLKTYQINNKNITNLHIHSKQLYQFSSIFDIKYNEIISGERFMDHVDYIVTTTDISDFHTSATLEHRQKYVHINVQNVQFPIKNTYRITYFVYTHLLDIFIQILDMNKETFKKHHVVIYCHNSDHEFTEEHYIRLKRTEITFTVYSQNPNCNIYDNVYLLPIGIANEMWPHGSILTLYKTMSKVYKYTKPNNIYINLSLTHPSRQTILSKLSCSNYVICEKKPYDQYLKELSSHMFSLCIRGNGIDTHRFWESLYLGTIPVVINTNDNYFKYLRILDIPFIELNELPTSSDYFNEELYKQVRNKYNIGCLKQLKIKNYT